MKIVKNNGLLDITGLTPDEISAIITALGVIGREGKLDVALVVFNDLMIELGQMIQAQQDTLPVSTERISHFVITTKLMNGVALTKEEQAMWDQAREDIDNGLKP